jgi:hypothetical protein
MAMAGLSAALVPLYDQLVTSSDFVAVTKRVKKLYKKNYGGLIGPTVLDMPDVKASLGNNPAVVVGARTGAFFEVFGLGNKTEEERRLILRVRSRMD